MNLPASAQLRDDLVGLLLPALNVYLSTRPPPEGKEWAMLLTEDQGFTLGAKTWEYITLACAGCVSVGIARADSERAGPHPRVVVLARCNIETCPRLHAHLLILDDGAAATAAAERLN